jgi:hypothetical protein
LTAFTPAEENAILQTGGSALPDNSKSSRREFVAGLALLGASSLVHASTDPVLAPATAPIADAAWSSDDRKLASTQLLNYFSKTAPQLLRPPEGVLTHPSIACSLPGKRYSTNLWDWGYLLDRARPFPLG